MLTPVAPRHLRHVGALLEAQRRDPGLFLARPAAAALPAGDHLDPADPASLAALPPIALRTVLMMVPMTTPILLRTMLIIIIKRRHRRSPSHIDADHPGLGARKKDGAGRNSYAQPP